MRQLVIQHADGVSSQAILCNARDEKCQDGQEATASHRSCQDLLSRLKETVNLPCSCREVLPLLEPHQPRSLRSRSLGSLLPASLIPFACNCEVEDGRLCHTRRPWSLKLTVRYPGVMYDQTTEPSARKPFSATQSIKVS